jgi:hypothetical protein
VDVPVSAVLLFLFVCSAVLNMTIFQINRRRDHKFVFSALLFGFSMARIGALVMRIVWATRPTNVNIAIASGVFTSAGVLLLFVVNLFFAQRILRAYHPTFGWHKAVDWAFRVLIACVIALLVMVITVTVQSFFTLDVATRLADRDVQLFASTFLATLAFLPIPIVAIAWLVPRASRVEKFGEGRFRTKIRLLLFTSALLTLGAGFRTGAAFAPRPITSPAWYHSQACYYIFNYGLELIVVYTYALARFDRRFHVPDGSSAPGHYAAGSSLPINREEDVFGDGDVTDAALTDSPDAAKDPEKQWEDAARREQSAEGSANV